MEERCYLLDQEVIKSFGMEVGKVPIVSNNVWNESLWNKLPSCDIVIEKLFGIPCEALTGRVVITVANKVFNIAFSPVNENGNASIDLLRS